MILHQTIDSVHPKDGAPPDKRDRVYRIKANFPTELLALPQWVVWRYVPRPGKKPGKQPFSPDGSSADVTAPRTLGTLEDCCDAYLSGNYDGVGFVFSEEIGVTGVDLDDCIVDSVKDDWAYDILKHFPNTYAERSVSGNGIHILTCSTAGKVGVNRKNIRIGEQYGNLEVYSGRRFFVVTGDKLIVHSSSISACPDGLAEVLRLAGVSENSKASPNLVDAPTTIISSAPAPGGSRDGATPIMADDELLRRIFAAKNGDQIRRLWGGDTSMHGGDHSSADQALCNHLAFYTGNDSARMDVLFRRSRLFRVDKWDRRSSSDGRTYGQMTIDLAIEGTSNTYTGRPVANATVTINISHDECIAPTGVGDQSPQLDISSAVPVTLPLLVVIAALRKFIHSINLADYVPVEHHCSKGYRTRETDLAVIDAHLDVFLQYGKLSGPIGQRQLQPLVNVGCHKTVGKAQERLTPWFVRRVESNEAVKDPTAAFFFEVNPELIAVALRTFPTHFPPPLWMLVGNLCNRLTRSSAPTMPSVRRQPLSRRKISIAVKLPANPIRHATL